MGSRTQPDQNTYLDFWIIIRVVPTPDYDYGRHFLFQGHENAGGNTNLAYVTRVNLYVAQSRTIVSRF